MRRAIGGRFGGDSEVLVKLREGDGHAIDTLLNQHGDGLIRLASRIVGSPDLAQDVVQEVFLHLWNERLRVEPDWDIAAYLFGLTRNRAINLAKSQQSTTRREDRWSAQYSIDSGYTQSLEDSTDDEESMIRAEIWDALMELSPRCRDVFMRVWDRQLPYADIARDLGLSEPTVRNYVSKAIKHLAIVLGPRYSR